MAKLPPIISPNVVWLAIIIILTAEVSAVSQKQITEREQTWIGYFHQSRLTRKSGLWLDLHFRTTDHFVRQKTMTVARAGYVYHLSDELRIIGGYAYANRYNQGGVTRVPEHRPWQQVQWIQQKSKFSFVQTFRIEQRYRKNIPDQGADADYLFNWRFRYGFSITVPLMKEKSISEPFFITSNEIMANAGSRIVYNYFDQNRTFAGFGYRFNRNLHVHLGYLFIFQQEASAGQFIHTHAIRLFVIHNADLRSETD